MNQPEGIRVPEEIRPLRDEDRELLKAFVGSSIFSVYTRMIENELIATYRALESATEAYEMFKLQGRLNGLRFALNAPVLLSRTVAQPKQKPGASGKREQKQD